MIKYSKQIVLRIMVSGDSSGLSASYIAVVDDMNGLAEIERFLQQQSGYPKTFISKIEQLNSIEDNIVIRQETKKPGE